MFQCDKCGCCCRHISNSPIYKELDRGDGVCRYLDMETRLCKIYINRPIFCNVDKFYEQYLLSECSIEEFYSINYESCEILKERYGK